MSGPIKALCPTCRHPVRLTVTTTPPRHGHANLPDGAELVCLDFGEGCTSSTCPLSGTAGIVMGVRLARSGMRPEEEWDTVHGRCQGCGRMADLEILDRSYGYCPICGTTNRLVLLEMDDESTIAITDEGDPGGG